MAREPRYPDDAPIGSAPGGGGEAGRPGAAAGDSKAGKTAATATDKGAEKDPKRNKHLVAGAAIGIGSAAIVAALLYANRKGKSDK